MSGEIIRHRLEPQEIVVERDPSSWTVRYGHIVVAREATRQEAIEEGIAFAHGFALAPWCPGVVLRLPAEEVR